MKKILVQLKKIRPRSTYIKIEAAFMHSDTIEYQLYISDDSIGHSPYMNTLKEMDEYLNDKIPEYKKVY